MAEVEQSPPLRWLFATPEQRRLAMQYWVTDTAVGLADAGAHLGMRLLPIDLCSAIGARLGALSKRRYPQSDARARLLWSKLRPEADQATVDAAMARLWRCVGRTMAEFSVLHRLWDAGRVSVIGNEHLDAARRTGRPLIGLSLHLGNWEVIPATAIKLGLRGAAFYSPPTNRFDHAIANRTRERIEGSYIKPGRAASHQAVKLLLKDKQNLLMWVDEFERGRVWAPAFGRPLRAEGNIAYIVRFARMTKALIVPLYCTRIGDAARFTVTVLPSFEPIDTGDPKRDLLATVAKIDGVIDPIVRAHLDQWFYALDFDFDK